MECRICGAEVEAFLSFGKMPIANAFLAPADFDSEFFFELAVAFCPACTMVQLIEQPNRDVMFHENYAYFSSISERMAAHFEHFADQVMREHLTDDKNFVVEIGSNDGIMLQHFATSNVHHLGIEPSANVAQAAREKGIQTLCEFFDEDLARRIKEEHGLADAVLAANVMCHIPYLHSVVSGVASLLKPKGLLIFEDPYLGDILEKTSYDQIYDEHAFYFSVTSIDILFHLHGMEVIDVEPQEVHGGSMRYVIARQGAHTVSEVVSAQKQKEETLLGLRQRSTFETFRSRVERSRDALKEMLIHCKEQGLRVVGYGATSKSTTVNVYCGITPELVEFISDTTPTKQNKFSPGAHIPIKAYEEFARAYPDVALLYAWNHGQEIMKHEKAFREAGGRWLVYVPEVEISE